MRAWLVGTWVLLAMPWGTLFGETPDLSRLARSAKKDFRAPQDADVSEARKRLRDAAAAFQSWMLSAGIEGAAWREQVLRDGFERRISSGEDLTPEELQTFADRLAPDVATREVWAIGDLRRAAERLALVLRDRSDDALKRKFEARLDALSAAMESHARRPDPSRLRQIADDLTWLDRRGQVPSVTAAVRAHFSHANFEARLSKRFIETVSLENVDQTEPIHDVLDGSEVRGRSRTVGRSFASPVADDGRLVLEFRLALSIHSRTFGCGGPLQGLVDATSHVTSTTQVVWDGRGFSSLPASARAEATVWSADVEDRQALGARRARRAACGRLAQRHAAKEWLVARRAERDVAHRFDHDVAAKVEAVNELYASRVRSLLTRHNQLPRQMTGRSTADEVRIRVLQANRAQLGAAADPPCPDRADLAITLHESAVNNLAEGLLGGKTFSEDEIIDLVQPFSEGAGTGTAPDGERLFVTLAPAAPLVVKIDDQALEVTIQGERYVIENRSYPAMNVRFRYKLAREGTGLRATLVDEPQIVPPDLPLAVPREYSAREVAIRSVLLNFLRRHLKPEIFQPTISLPDAVAHAGKLEVVELRADEGWLVIGLRQIERIDPAGTENPPEPPLEPSAAGKTQHLQRFGDRL